MDSPAKIIAITLEKTLMIFLLIKSPDLEIIKKTINVFSRVIAIILAALSVQYIMDGILELTLRV